MVQANARKMFEKLGYKYNSYKDDPYKADIVYIKTGDIGNKYISFELESNGEYGVCCDSDYCAELMNIDELQAAYQQLKELMGNEVV